MQNARQVATKWSLLLERAQPARETGQSLENACFIVVVREYDGMMTFTAGLRLQSLPLGWTSSTH